MFTFEIPRKFQRTKKISRQINNQSDCCSKTCKQIEEMWRQQANCLKGIAFKYRLKHSLITDESTIYFRSNAFRQIFCFGIVIDMNNNGFDS